MHRELTAPEREWLNEQAIDVLSGQIDAVKSSSPEFPLVILSAAKYDELCRLPKVTRITESAANPPHTEDGKDNG